MPGAPDSLVPAKRSLDGSVRETPDHDDPRDEDGPGLADERTGDAPGLQDRPSHDAENGHDASNNSGPSLVATNVQILDLHSENPIISYMDQIYSCKWTDMVGTNMFFTDPGLSAEANATMLSTEDYDLVGLSRIKLLGQRGKVAKNMASASEGRADDARTNEQSVEADDAHDGRSLGDLKTSNPKLNKQIKKQAAFLEKMMDLKRQRGEQDIVRVYVDEQSAPDEKTEVQGAMREEVDRLNRQALKGNAEALARLQEIYSRTEAKEQTPQNAPPALPDNDAM